MKELNFITKTRTYNRNNNADVLIGVIKNKSNLKSKITFYNDIERKFATEYIVIAIDNNRIYFKGADVVTGYKLSRYTDNIVATCFASNQEVADFFSAHRGYYNLEYDKERELYYIDCEV